VLSVRIEGRMRGNNILEGVRILVIEDETDTRNLLAFLLESEGATAFPVDNVMDALDEFIKRPPDIVVSDIGMPDYNGYAFIAAVRHQKSQIRRTPVIALTAFSTPADRDTALISGFDEYLAKPFEPEQLICTIKRLCDEHRIGTAA
jgi:DNA-binding response OmpR family regulator